MIVRMLGCSVLRYPIAMIKDTRTKTATKTTATATTATAAAITTRSTAEYNGSIDVTDGNVDDKLTLT